MKFCFIGLRKDLQRLVCLWHQIEILILVLAGRVVDWLQFFNILRVYVWHFSVLRKIEGSIASHVTLHDIKMLNNLKFYQAVNIPTKVKDQIRGDVTCDRFLHSLPCKMYYEEDFGWKINDENISVVINCLRFKLFSFPDAQNRISVRIEEAALYLSLLICLTDIIKVCCLQLSRSTSWIAITFILLGATACLEREASLQKKIFS